MTNYPVRTTHRARLTPEAIAETAREAFGSADIDGGTVTVAYGALIKLSVRPEGRELSVTTAMDPKVSAEVAGDTVRRYNRFLEQATGYSSKERAKRLKKSATASPGKA